MDILCQVGARKYEIYATAFGGHLVVTDSLVRGRWGVGEGYGGSVLIVPLA